MKSLKALISIWDTLLNVSGLQNKFYAEYVYNCVTTPKIKTKNTRQKHRKINFYSNSALVDNNR